MLFVVCILSWGEVLEDVEHVFRRSFHVFRGSSFGLLFSGFALCVPMAWSPSCLPCEESVRALLSSDLVFVLCWTFDHLWSLWCFIVDFSFIFHIVTVCVVNALIKGRLRTRSVRGPEWSLLSDE